MPYHCFTHPLLVSCFFFLLAGKCVGTWYHGWQYRIDKFPPQLQPSCYGHTLISPQWQALDGCKKTGGGGVKQCTTSLDRIIKLQRTRFPSKFQIHEDMQAKVRYSPHLGLDLWSKPPHSWCEEALKYKCTIHSSTWSGVYLYKVGLVSELAQETRNQYS